MQIIIHRVLYGWHCQVNGLLAGITIICPIEFVFGISGFRELKAERLNKVRVSASPILYRNKYVYFTPMQNEYMYLTPPSWLSG